MAAVQIGNYDWRVGSTGLLLSAKHLEEKMEFQKYEIAEL